MIELNLDYYPATGDIRRSLTPNPIPERAVEERAGVRGSKLTLAEKAAARSGVLRVNWDKVMDLTQNQKRLVSQFKSDFQLGNLLAINAKTDKPRQSTNRYGLIKGMNLSPHYYPNLLNVCPVDGEGHLQSVPRQAFFGFDGTNEETVLETVNGPGAKLDMKGDSLLSFCTGSSSYCRSTCLVTTGQHATGQKAGFSKMKATFAFLSEPEMFVALLHRQLNAFAKQMAEKQYDAVVRLNMLSDLPWYSMCPELFKAHGPKPELPPEKEALTRCFMYDYTKNLFWRTKEYNDLVTEDREGNIVHLLDLTFSYSGENQKQCVEALKNGHRVAAVFAPEDKSRRAIVDRRTTWRELLMSGLISREGRGKNEKDYIDGALAEQFGGNWQIVDGDKSDYRIDDPPNCIVALNFKESVIRDDIAPHLGAAIKAARGTFAISAPDIGGRGIKYIRLRARRLWREVFPSGANMDRDSFEPEELERLAEEYEALAPRGKKAAIAHVRQVAEEILGEKMEVDIKKQAANMRNRDFWTKLFKDTNYPPGTLSDDEVLAVAGAYYAALEEYEQPEAIQVGRDTATEILREIANDSERLAELSPRAQELVTQPGFQIRPVTEAVANRGRFYLDNEGEETPEAELEREQMKRAEESPVTPDARIPMGRIPGTNILIGPHVPTIVKD